MMSHLKGGVGVQISVMICEGWERVKCHDVTQGSLFSLPINRYTLHGHWLG